VSSVTQWRTHSNQSQRSAHPYEDLNRIRLVVKVVLLVLVRLALVRVVLNAE
jgi:hypothetical protein